MKTKEFSIDRKFMHTISKVLKNYESIEKFEEEWDCKLMYVASGHISGVVFNSDAAMTGFYLKYVK